jgi:hypothetical protein
MKLDKKHLWKVLYRDCSLVAMFVNDRDKMSNPYREPSIYASYQVSVHLAKQFQRRRFLEINQLETRFACGSHICIGSGQKVRSIYRRSSMGMAHSVLIR